jgi:exo-beta-1,3-glucanase (GH17 family)
MTDADLTARITALRQVVSKAKATNGADVLSKEMAAQSAANDKLLAELDKLQAEFNAYWQRVCENHL